MYFIGIPTNTTGFCMFDLQVIEMRFVYDTNYTVYCFCESCALNRCALQFYLDLYKTILFPGAKCKNVFGRKSEIAQQRRNVRGYPQGRGV